MSNIRREAGVWKAKANDKILYIKIIAEDTSLTVGDGKAKLSIPSEYNGMNLINAHAAIYTVSSSGLPTVQIHNLTDGVDMLSTLITIDVSELNSYTAAAQPVINTDNDAVATGDILRIDVDLAGTGVTGLDIILTFGLP